jgi:hypothetical protein
MVLAEQDKVFTLRTGGAASYLKVGGMIVLIIGIGFVVVLVWALRMEATGGVDAADQSDALELIILLVIFSPVALYAASLMLLLRVKLTNHTLSSGGGFIFRRWARSQVIAVDLRQHAFGRTARVVPFVVLRDGRSYPMLPLARLDPNTLLPWQRTFVPSVTSQLNAVAELRAALGVGGADLASEETTSSSSGPPV